MHVIGVNIMKANITNHKLNNNSNILSDIVFHIYKYELGVYIFPI